MADTYVKPIPPPFVITAVLKVVYDGKRPKYLIARNYTQYHQVSIVIVSALVLIQAP